MRPDWRDVVAKLDADSQRRVEQMRKDEAAAPARMCRCRVCGRRWQRPAAQGVKALSACGRCRRLVDKGGTPKRQGMSAASRALKPLPKEAP
jgi:hypothetical protein